MAIQSNFPSVRPSLLLDFANTKQLDSRITYTRASTASFYNGVTTAMAEQNLLTYSQDFSNADWTKYKASITANTTTAPDGTATASTITENNENFQHLVYRNNANNLITTGNIGTLSIYAKANTRSWINLNLYDGSNRLTWFDLTNGVVGTNAAGNTATITSVGSGWYRCIISRTIANGSVFSPEYGISSGDNVYTYLGNGTSSIYIWGAQLEQRSAVTAYTATTTQAITNYIPVLQSAASGVARFDNNPTTGESLGLLIEESRTNIALYSSEFNNWTAFNATTLSNIAIAPDGTQTADKIIPDATNNTHGFFRSVTVTASTSYTQSFYVKAGEYSWMYMTEGNTLTASAYFNLATGVVGLVGGTGSPSATITSVGNGWYRCTMTFTTAVGQTLANIQVRPAAGDNSPTYTGNGFNGIYAWGAQFEAGAFATSYIPTVASQVTRAADAASMTGTNFSTWYNQAEGTIYSEAAVYAIGSRGIFDFTDGTTSNQMTAFAGTGSSGQRHLNVRVSGSTVATLDGGSYADGAYSKQATVLKANDFALSLAGATAVTALSGSAPIVNQMLIGNSTTSASVLNGTLKKIAYYPIRVTNAQLQALTS